MALPASGQISMDDIRVELGVPTQSPFGLNEARSGTYVALNQNSLEFEGGRSPLIFVQLNNVAAV